MTRFSPPALLMATLAVALSWTATPASAQTADRWGPDPFEPHASDLPKQTVPHGAWEADDSWSFDEGQSAPLALVPATNSYPGPGGLDEFPIALEIDLGFWTGAELDLKMAVGGNAATLTGLTIIDAADDLDLDDSDDVPLGRIHLDTRWLGVRLTWWQVRYTGLTSLARDISFGNINLTLNATVRSKFEAKSGLLQFHLNILNDETLRLGPFLGVRVMRVKAEIAGDADGDGVFELTDRKSQTVPLPQLGLEAVLHLGDIAQVSLRVSHFDVAWIGLGDVDGQATELDFGLTVWPLAAMDLPELGLRLSYLHHVIDVKNDDDDADDAFAADMALRGILLSLSYRF